MKTVIIKSIKKNEIIRVKETEKGIEVVCPKDLRLLVTCVTNDNVRLTVETGER